MDQNISDPTSCDEFIIQPEKAPDSQFGGWFAPSGNVKLGVDVSEFISIDILITDPTYDPYNQTQPLYMQAYDSGKFS